MDYSLLFNTVYLYLLSNPDAEINFSKIGEKFGLTRQTISKEYHYLIENKIDFTNNIYNIKNFYFDASCEVERAMCIYIDINGYTTAIDIENNLKLSSHTVFRYLPNVKRRVGLLNDKPIELTQGVYAILYNNEIIYIGSSRDIAGRFKEHKKNLIAEPAPYDRKIYRYCKENNIQFDQLNFVVLLHTVNYLEIEKNMIKTIQPICNE